jgi:aspartyl protease family protein
MRRIELFAACLLLSASVFAQEQTVVQVVGLFPNAAVIYVDGLRKLVKVGQTGPSGVQVVSADSHGAVLRVDGVERRYEISREYSQAAQLTPRRTQVSLARSNSGHYWAPGSIQGYPVQFLVDTGATSIAMNEEQARKLGIDYRVQGREQLVSTANGNVKAWGITLDSVKVGAIEVLGVQASVLQGPSPSEVLLGMSFLNRVSWREQQGLLQLEAKY